MKTVKHLVDKYYNSNDFKMLRSRTKKDYKYFLSIMLDDFGSVNFCELTSKQAKHAYEAWVVRGISLANHVCTVSSILFRYAIEMEHTHVNPFANIKRKTPPQRKVVWTEDDVRQFLDTAYAKFEHRSIGLIVHMAYEWCQRLGDMRMLTWDNIDLDNKKLNLEQSKRRAEVTLPIEDDLLEMLIQQEQDFGFQKYVAPHPYPRGGRYAIYSDIDIGVQVNQVKKVAGLPKDLTAMDMRRTAITEMVEAGVDTTQIMAVSGHNSPNSMRPYIKHTYKSAANALDRRKESKNGEQTY